MKKVVFFLGMVILFCFSGSSQSNPLIADYSSQGYQTGCELASTYDVQTYQATISNPHFPADYKDGVRLAWQNCPKPSQQGALTESQYGDLIGRYFQNGLLAIILDYYSEHRHTYHNE
ncbi:hypothetical protein [Flagellimonas allohymeniacidonis]|uniref:Uncharacterized protein n=1 Tax=Flagellimonas allohymeniacidonis TaxID=2517819 RepID=A0A4Q8QJR5_9FLAO|nr:hypothetical protein [Allomuricauda hymeniacidonis]TAI48476.1 hypothetical protein EW142_01335 [Allomuricauda hymeniacidonis]